MEYFRNSRAFIKKTAADEEQFGTPSASESTPRVNPKDDSAGAKPKDGSPARAESINDYFFIAESLNAKDQMLFFEQLATNFNYRNIYKQTYDSYIRSLDKMKPNVLAMNIGVDVCSNVNRDNSDLQTFSPEEVFRVYSWLLKNGAVYLEHLEKIRNDRSSFGSNVEALRAKSTGTETETKLPSSTKRAEDAIFSPIENDIRETILDIVRIQREANVYMRLMPIKQAFFDTSLNVCLALKDAENTKDIVGFYSREQMDALVSGYDRLISVLQSYIKVLPLLLTLGSIPPQTLAQETKKIQTFIKAYEGEKNRIYKTVFERLMPKI